eukprot:1188452-Prorocentrum_minimum.AAC.1
MLPACRLGRPAGELVGELNSRVTRWLDKVGVVSQIETAAIKVSVHLPPHMRRQPLLSTGLDTDMWHPQTVASGIE